MIFRNAGNSFKPIPALLGGIALVFIFLENSHAATVTFQNQSGAAVSLFFVDADGAEDHYTDIPSGGQYAQELTFKGDKWRIKQGAVVVAEYVTTDKESQNFPITGGSSSGIEKSPISQNAVSLTVNNNLANTAQIFWVNYEGGEQSYGEVKPNAKWGINTGEGHIWRFKVNGAVVSTYAATGEKNQNFQLGKAAKKSIPGGKPVILTGLNALSKDVEVFWVDFDGVEKPYKYIRPNGKWVINTGEGQIWRFKSGGKTVVEYTATGAERQSLTIKPDTAGGAEQDFASLSGDEQYFDWLTAEQPRLLEEKSPALLAWAEGFKGQTLDIDTESRKGYHILRLNPTKLQDKGLGSSAALIFKRFPQESKDYDLERGFMIPNEFLLNPLWDSEGSKSVNMYFSESERTQSFSLNVGVSAGKPGKEEGGQKTPPGPKVGAKYERKEEKSAFSETERISITSTRWGAQFWLTVRKDKIQLSDLFKQEVRKLSSDYADYKLFFETFGTHYPLSTLYGGMAYYEEFATMDKVGSAISKSNSFSVSGSAPVKGVEVAAEVGYSNSDSSRMAEMQRQENAKFITRGGYTGANFDQWQLSDTESKSLVPIKVDLRPVWELVWPRKFDATDSTSAADIMAKQNIMRTMYDKYIEEENRSITQYASLKPRIFAVRIDSVRVVEDDDDGGDGPDLWGYLNFFVFKDKLIPISFDKPKNLAASVWSVWDTDLETTFAKVKPVSVGIGDFSNVDKAEMLISIMPLINEIPSNTAKTYAADYQLHRYSFFPSGYFRDDDCCAFAHEDDWMTLEGSGSAFTLQDVVNAGGFKSGKASQRADGLGKVEVNYSVREIKYEIQSEGLNLPDFPKFN